MSSFSPVSKIGNEPRKSNFVPRHFCIISTSLFFPLFTPSTKRHTPTVSRYPPDISSRSNPPYPPIYSSSSRCRCRCRWRRIDSSFSLYPRSTTIPIPSVDDDSPVLLLPRCRTSRFRSHRHRNTYYHHRRYCTLPFPRPRDNSSTRSTYIRSSTPGTFRKYRRGRDPIDRMSIRSAELRTIPREWIWLRLGRFVRCFLGFGLRRRRRRPLLRRRRRCCSLHRL
mmetsp:Transcript_17010/g.26678  ORF Transcript_17010/g.26678 Transcript_17010/m.26678 type:complete len:224 (-) Transcript_17010:30-701(-)